MSREERPTTDELAALVDDLVTVLHGAGDYA
jgi:hypothetical protein